MTKIIYKVLIITCALLLAAHLIDGIVVIDLYAAIIAAVILGILNAVVKPILLILTLPVTIVTHGLFAFVINASLFLFVASFVDGFDVVGGFWSALLGSLIVSVVSVIGNRFIK